MPDVMPTTMQMSMIEDYATSYYKKNPNFDPQTIDYEAEVDSTLSYPENLNNFKKKYDMRGLMSEKEYEARTSQLQKPQTVTKIVYKPSKPKLIFRTKIKKVFVRKHCRKGIAVRAHTRSIKRDAQRKAKHFGYGNRGDTRYSRYYKGWI